MPLGPTSPTLSPRRMVAVKFFTITLSPNDLLTSVNSAITLPDRAPLVISSFTRPSVSRRAARQAQYSRARTRPLIAGAPRLGTPFAGIHTSCASSLSNLALTVASN